MVEAIGGGAWMRATICVAVYRHVAKTLVRGVIGGGMPKGLSAKGGGTSSFHVARVPTQDPTNGKFLQRTELSMLLTQWQRWWHIEV